MKHILYLIIMIVSLFSVNGAQIDISLESDQAINTSIECNSPNCNFDLGNLDEGTTIKGNIHHSYPQTDIATSFYEHVKRYWEMYGLELLYPDATSNPIDMLMTIMTGFFVQKADFDTEMYKQRVLILEEEVKILKELNNVNQDELDLQICLRMSKDSGEVTKYKEIECMWYD